MAHPHPPLGGSATHKVPHQVAKVLLARGFRFLTVRPNFRRVEGSAGEHEQGSGEAQDMLAVVAHLREAHPGLPLALAGFSFGAFVMAHVCRHAGGAVRADPASGACRHAVRHHQGASQL